MPIPRISHMTGWVSSILPRACDFAHALRKNLVREPDAGNPHVRFDERGRETELWQAGMRRCARKSQQGHRKPKVTAPVLDSTDFRVRASRLQVPRLQADRRSSPSRSDGVPRRTRCRRLTLGCRRMERRGGRNARYPEPIETSPRIGARAVSKLGGPLHPAVMVHEASGSPRICRLGIQRCSTSS